MFNSTAQFLNHTEECKRYLAGVDALHTCIFYDFNGDSAKAWTVLVISYARRAGWIDAVTN